MGRRFKLWWKLGLVLVIAAGVLFYWLRPLFVKIEGTTIADGIHVKFRTNGTQVEEYADQAWKPYFAKGVNMGAAIPGHFPGELAITEEQYERWFRMIQEMGANVIRVYTIMKPEFYEALVKYNRANQHNPLYLIQGVWSPEEELIDKQDAYDPEIMQAFEQEIRDAVAAVYGKTTLAPEPHSGKAAGAYTYNAGPYLMGWIVGTEWEPNMVKRTNELHADIPDYEGQHFRSKPGANAFEKWLALMVDTAAQAEIQYGWQHPIAFSNWVTTDPLEHPGEPLFEEDMVSVDPAHIEATDWAAGYFASYHVYPYYPDFFAFDTTYQTMTNSQGQIDSYTAYLHKLKEFTSDMPIMITEFGVPASLGIAHLGMLGRDQGGHNEQQQGEINADLLQQIHGAGYSGAILFTWQDEWFKKTWNTLHYDDPDRRAFWYNTLTNESFFGVLGMFPGKDDVLFIDGDASDWEQLGADEKQRLDVQAPGFEEIWVTHDEGYLYLMAKLSEPFDPSRRSVYFGVDTIAGGNRHAPQLHGMTLDEGLETLMELSDEEMGRMWIASNYDVHARLYEHAGLPEIDPKEKLDDSGIFKPWMLAVNYRLEYPDSRFDYPFGDVEAGQLERGYTDPSRSDYNSKAMWQVQGQVLEMRIPWMLMGFSDPSSLSVIDYNGPSGNVFGTTEAEGVRIVPWMAQDGEVVGREGADAANPYPVSSLPIYSWQRWEENVDYVERPKQSYWIVKEAMEKIAGPVAE
ncbi:hypothetical protein DUZ99_19800 [Xylanibacillus composti]|uniref:Family 2 glycosyl transferase n=1 Tax=Xylanibacillus composti TaxID=1572762 RepID=A0A8J4H631_9BACL|nr:hypothetical protein [Xylanibacillus composti]MDT9727210.1 hypothetical protein [Xylanibacillus composti]GIQ71519.1 hypothetical protein XYCOK13_43430 [Xylanibacillus composti]